MKKGEIFRRIQGLEDRIVDRFCSVKRRMEFRTDWVPETTPYAELETEIRERIRFYEARGYYLFQEPFLEHEPAQHRFRAVLTFRPSESNQ